MALLKQASCQLWGWACGRGADTVNDVRQGQISLKGLYGDYIWSLLKDYWALYEEC